MGHPRPRLSVFSRQLLVMRVAGWLAGCACRRAARHQPGDRVQVAAPVPGRGRGRARSTGPPGRTARHAGERHARGARSSPPVPSWRYGPDRLGPLLGLPPSTVHRVLARRGFSRLRDADRVTAAPVRYVACHPGALAPPGPQEARPHPRRRRLAESTGRGSRHQPAARQRRVRASRGRHRRRQPLRRRRPRPRRDRRERRPPRSRSRPPSSPASASGSSASSPTTAWPTRDPRRMRQTLAGLGARHKRTRPYRPQTNGKAERFIQTLLDEWAYARPYRSNDERAAALPAFVDFYNRRRPHTALGGRSPLDAVNNVPRDHS